MKTAPLIMNKTSWTHQYSDLEERPLKRKALVKNLLTAAGKLAP